MENVAVWAILALGLALVVGLIWAAYDCLYTETFSLRKTDWVCASYRRVESTHYIMIGKVMVPQTTTDNVCVNWMRK